MIKAYLFYTLILFTFQFKIFATNEFDITQFGAKGDGKTLNTQAIQRTIEAAAKVGGTVVIPKGKFLSATIFLKSNITFQINQDAHLLASSNIKDYQTMTWGHHKDRTPWHLLVAKNQENIRITGTGSIDGNSLAFREKTRRNEFSFYHELAFRPSPLVEIQACKNIIIDNITITDSPGWTLHLYDCDMVKVDKISIQNYLLSPNSDGIDVTGSHDVSISNCFIVAGDDAIALKTTEDSRSCERIVITNCIFETNCVALRIGYESRKDFKNITMSNCIVKNASRAIDLRTVEGGNIENIIINGLIGQVNSGWAMDRVIEIDANKIQTPYKIDIPEHPNYSKAKPVEKAGYIKNVIIENLMIRTAGRILLSALPETSIENVTLRNITLDYFLLEDPYQLGLKAENSVGFANQMPFVRSTRACLVAENVKGLYITNFNINWPKYPVSEECKLLKSPNRLFNPYFFNNNEDKIKSGEFKVAFKPFAFKNVNEAFIEVNNLSSSSGNKQDILENQHSIITIR